MVALMWVLRSSLRILVDSTLSPLYRVTSRNVSSVSLISYVNLIVGWIWLVFDMYFLKLSVSIIMKIIIIYESLPSVDKF